MPSSLHPPGPCAAPPPGPHLRPRSPLLTLSTPLPGLPWAPCPAPRPPRGGMAPWGGRGRGCPAQDCVRDQSLPPSPELYLTLHPRWCVCLSPRHPLPKCGLTPSRTRPGAQQATSVGRSRRAWPQAPSQVLSQEAEAGGGWGGCRGSDSPGAMRVPHVLTSPRCRALSCACPSPSCLPPGTKPRGTGRNIPGRGNSRCQGPGARRRWTKPAEGPECQARGQAKATEGLDVLRAVLEASGCRV